MPCCNVNHLNSPLTEGSKSLRANTHASIANASLGIGKLMGDPIELAAIRSLGWTFDSALNAIVFDAEHVPENGDLIEIEYTVLGDCQD